MGDLPLIGDLLQGKEVGDSELLSTLCSIDLTRGE